MPSTCELVVSIQRFGVPDLVDGHLAWGVLVRSDVVLAPVTGRWTEGSGAVAAVLAATSAQGPSVERIMATEVDVVGSDGVPDGAVAVVRLAQGSAFAPRDATVALDVLQASLARDGDLWAALESTGAVPRTVRQLPVPQTLRTVGQWEAAQALTLVRSRTFGGVDVVGIRLCKLIRICDCGGQQW